MIFSVRATTSGVAGASSRGKKNMEWLISSWFDRTLKAVTRPVGAPIGRNWSLSAARIALAAGTLAATQTAPAVMTTPGSPSVSPSGASGYSIPIAIGKGTGGMQPTLSIGYSSQSGEGSLGVGWNLQGLSAVTRCSRTIAQDGVTQGVMMQPADSLCLDGARLIAVGTNTSACGAVYTPNKEYRTEIESFSRVCGFGDGTQHDWFRVWTKSGLVMDYGATADSRIEAQGTSAAHTWGMNKTADRNGNYYTVTYYEDTSIGASRVERIDYTGNAALGIAPYASVTFEYSSNYYNTPVYLAGSYQSNPWLLGRINVNEGASLVRKYEFSYDYDGAGYRGRLKYVREYDRTGLVSKLPLTFNWPAWPSLSSQSNFNGIVNPASYTWTDYGGYVPVQGDFNGDGKADILWDYRPGSAQNSQGLRKLWLSANPPATVITNVANQNNNLYGYLPLIADFNGDGKSDILWYHDVTPDVTPQVWLSNGDGTFQIITNPLPGNALPNNNNGIGIYRPVAGDFNGDGRLDLLWVLQDGYGRVAENSPMGNRLRLWYGNPSGAPNGTFVQTADGLPYVGGNVTIPHDHVAQVGDFNGDGLADILWDRKMADGRGDGMSRILWVGNTGGGFTETPNLMGANGNLLGWGTVLTDINGDGKTDIVLDERYADGRSAGHRIIWVSYGGSNGVFGWEGNMAGQDGSFIGWTMNSADINGDGKADFAWDYEDTNLGSYGQRAVWLSRGNRMFDVVANFSGQDGNWYGTTMQVFDIDGDGRADIFLHCKNCTDMFLATSNLGAGDMVSSVDNGLGATITFNYKPLTDSSVYTKGTGATFPVMDVQGAMRVVSRLSLQTPEHGTQHTDYKYGAARVHAQGRGMLGFATFETTDVTTGVKATRTFSQSYPYTGVETRNETRSSGGVLLAEADTTLQAYSFGGTRYFPYVSQTVKKGYELNGGGFVNRSTSAFTYDGANGDLTQLTVSGQDQGNNPTGYVNTTVNVYTSDLTNWILSRLICAANTSSVPGETRTRTSSFTYDSSTGQLASETVEPGVTCGSAPAASIDATLRLITTYGYDGAGNITSTTIASGVASGNAAYFAPRTSTVDYSNSYQKRFATTLTNALGHTETREFAQPYWNTPSRMTGPNGLITDYTFDDFGRPLTETLPDGTVTSTSYALCSGACAVNGITLPASYKITTTRTGAPTAVAYFDRLGRNFTSQVTNFDGTQVLRGYKEFDVIGRATKEYIPTSGALGAYSQYGYDVLGRVIETKSPHPTAGGGTFGGTSTIAYAPLKITTTNAKGEVTEQTLNSEGQKIQVKQAVGTGTPTESTTAFQFGAFGVIKQTTDPRGFSTTIVYDLRGRKSSMTEPSTGTTNYTYDALGQLKTQTDANNKTISYTYDVLGRVLTRADDSTMISTFAYDTLSTSDLTGYCSGIANPKMIGRLTRAATTLNYTQVHCFDDKSRAKRSNYVVPVPSGGTQTLTRDFSYDSAGRLDVATYPGGAANANFAIKNVYNANGYLEKVVNNATQTLAYWTANTINAIGAITQETAGNGLVTMRTIDNLGRLTAQTVGPTAGSGSIQNITVGYDAVSNVTSQSWYDGTTTRSETFGYDALGRITSVTGPQNRSFIYDVAGNFTTKSGVGTYNYGAPSCNSKPHAVSFVTGTVNGVTNPYYCYDQVGNLITERAGSPTGAIQRQLTWTSFNLPELITQGSSSVELRYGPARERIRQVKNGTETTYYVPGYEQWTSGTLTEHRNYISAGGGLVAIRIHRSDNNNSSRFVHRDHLGSTAVLSNSSGGVDQRLSYDAWGKRRLITGLDGSEPSPLTRWGYTGHEHLDNVSLVHMNGRVYDPTLGRFTSADPFLDGAADGQSYSRYSYVKNNPISMTDPSGHFSWRQALQGTRNIATWTAAFSVGGPAGAALAGMNLNSMHKTIHSDPAVQGNDDTVRKYPWVGQVQTIAVVAVATWACGPCSIAVAGGMAAVTTYAQGGDYWRAALIASATAAAFYGVGQLTTDSGVDFYGTEYSIQNPYTAVIGHAAVGCASEAAAGGNCAVGALAAGSGKALALGGVIAFGDPKSWSFNQHAAMLSATAVVGGVSAVLTGRDFWRGARMAAAGYMHNNMILLAIVGGGWAMWKGMEAGAAVFETTQIAATLKGLDNALSAAISACNGGNQGACVSQIQLLSARENLARELVRAGGQMAQPGPAGVPR